MKNVLTGKQFADKKILEEIFAVAKELQDADVTGHVPKKLAGKVVATVFYEPSTRTRLSFESGALKLGAGVISLSDPKSSSASKGETLEDSIKIVSSFSDIVVLRHPENGAAERAASVASTPVINAGDGTNEHPTQALYDVYTIEKELGSLDGKTIVYLGDHKSGRALHSILPMLLLYKVKIICVSPAELRLPDIYKKMITDAGVEFEEMVEIEPALKVADVLYVARIMKERFSSEEEYNRLKDSYLINMDTLKQMKPTAIIMAALPRVGEIDPAIDADHRAAYFRQAKNGLYVRMALLLYSLGM